MFGRLLWKLLCASRGRLAVALVALVSGGAVISALINLNLDVERKLTQEFRTLGANLVIDAPRAPALSVSLPSPAAGGLGASRAGAGPESPQLFEDSALPKIEGVRTPDVVAAAPYLYIVARGAAGQAVVVAGTWLDQTRPLEPWLKVQGEWIFSRYDMSRCLVGAGVARQFQVGPGSQIELRYGDRTARLAIAGVANAGGTEDNQIFVNLGVAQQLAGLEGKIETVQLSVVGSAKEITARANQLAQALPGLEVRPVRQIAEAEGALLERIRLLIFLMVALILALTVLCVLATMAALAMERRADVGLMKALGGSISRVVSLFLAEVGVLGAVGGLLGYIAGVGLARWMGERVFGAAISPRLEVLPLTVALMMGVALAGALPLRLLGRVRPAVILRGE